MADKFERGNLTRKQVRACKQWIDAQTMFADAIVASDAAQADPDLPEIDMMEFDLLGGPGVVCPRCGKQDYPVGRAMLDGFGSFAKEYPAGLELDNEEGDPHAITWETGCCQLPFRPLFVQHAFCHVHGSVSSVPGFPNACAICEKDHGIRAVVTNEEE